MEDETKRKNVVVLTIIAIVTMLVVVIGATFAYFANSIQGMGNSNLNVVTEGTSDLFIINAGDAIEILANETNFDFGNIGVDLTDETYASVAFQSNADTTQTRDYNITLEVDTNNLEYTSGTCYVKGEANALTEDECTTIWATSDGVNYACYPNTLTPVYSASNQMACTASDENVWQTEENTELALDFFKVDNTITTESACTNVGKCYDAKRSEVSTYTTKSACENANNYWVASVYHNNKCYAIQDSYDITVDESGSTRTIVSDAAINSSSTIGKSVDYYMVRASLLNLDHNQIKNADKEFRAEIKYTAIGIGTAEP